MIHDVLRGIDYSVCSELALALFFTVFIAVTIRTLLADRAAFERHASSAINDHQEPSE